MKQKLLEINLVVDNEYLDKYIKLIKENTTTKKETFITQEHHIIPKYYFKHNNLLVDNSSENKVHLKFSDHLLAHYYLMKCSSCTLFELANANAIIKSKDNIHSIDLENWIINNEELLQDINKRRCELISLHHADFSGNKNGRATKIYQFDLQGNFIQEFETIDSCAKFLNISAGSLRSMLTGKKNPFKLLKVNDKIYSKILDINKDTLNSYLSYRQSIEKSNQDKKHSIYTFTCAGCGINYSISVSNKKAQNKILSNHFCETCTKSGIMFKNKHKSDDQKAHMSQSAKGRKWVNNGIVAKQLHEPILSEYLLNGWVLGQLKKGN